jgi:signal transduction histidine kinase/putative methionine-R-sulfoxide reductase with GAF domain
MMAAVRNEDDRLKTAYEERVRALESLIRQRERELLVLSHVAARVHGEEDPDAILDIALDEILTRMGLASAWIFTGDDREKKLRLAAARGVSEAWLDEVRTEGLGECLCPEVFWTGHRMQARNTTQCPRMPDIIEGLAAPVAHACIPLKFEGSVRGVLNVAARPGEQFTEEQLRFLETLGHQIGLAVERGRHREAERLRNQEARALAAVSKAMGGSLEPAAVLKAVGDAAREVLGADRVIILLGAEPARVQVAYLGGLPHPELKPNQVLDLEAMEAKLQVRALRERRAYFVDDWRTDARVNQAIAGRWEAASGVVAALATPQRTSGLLILTSTTVRRWGEDEMALAEAFAAQAAVALDNAHLFEESRRAYRELKDAQQRILQSEKMAVLGTFASGLAHEIRNPLNSISLQMSLLERRIAKLEPAAGKALRELADVVREEIRRLDGLVGDFLLFSRADRMQNHLANLEALLDEVLRLLEPEAAAAGVELARRHAGPALPEFRMDAEKVKQVVINLVRNAVEAMPAGGTVTLETALVDGQAQLVVRDNGPGLPEGVDVFQLFVTTKPKGTGLGLSIVQQIVLQHGGEIAASSPPGQGAAFTIRLPITAAGVREGEQS